MRHSWFPVGMDAYVKDHDATACKVYENCVNLLSEHNALGDRVELVLQVVLDDGHPDVVEDNVNAALLSKSYFFELGKVDKAR